MRVLLLNRRNPLARAMLVSQVSVLALPKVTYVVPGALSARHTVVRLQLAALCREAFARLLRCQHGADAVWFGCLYLLLYNSHCVCVCMSRLSAVPTCTNVMRCLAKFTGKAPELGRIAWCRPPWA